MSIRHFLTLQDYSKAEIEEIIDLAIELKLAKKNKKEIQKLRGKNFALIFEKSSTRTRCAFEVAAYDQGANITYLEPQWSHIGEKESVKDTARVLGRMYDAIQYRGYSHSIVEIMAEYAGVPVWNGLTDQFHPTQVLADLMTIKETARKPWKGITLVFIGDGRNNIANSLLIGSSKIGLNFRIVAPKELQPEKNLIEKCNNFAIESGANIIITDDVKEGVKGADFIYTDVWVSLGEPEEVWDTRISLLMPYRVDDNLIELTKNSNVKFMHCLPAIHNKDTAVGNKIWSLYNLDGVEVTDEVFESEKSIVFEQAENRVHTIKSMMIYTLNVEK